MKRTNLQFDLPYKEEGELLAKAIEWLEPQRREGIKVLRICDRYAKGYSDLFICVRGIFVCAELKDDIGVASAHQEQFIEDMSAAGAVCGVCRTLREISNLVEEAKRRATYWTSNS